MYYNVGILLNLGRANRHIQQKDLSTVVYTFLHDHECIFIIEWNTSLWSYYLCEQGMVKRNRHMYN